MYIILEAFFIKIISECINATLAYIYLLPYYYNAIIYILLYS